MGVVFLGRTYFIRKVEEKEITPAFAWENIEKAEIDCYPWDINGYRPKTEARVVYSEKGFHVFLISYEKEILATRVNMNDPVCRDSCMEFFFSPDPDNDGRYFNFELNPIGTLLLGICKNRFDSKAVDVSPEIFRIKTSVTKEKLKSFSGPSWNVQFFIPFEFIESFYGKLEFGPGMKMKGNFYNCGDETRFPHFGCWNPISTEKPDFHRPEFFGDLVLE